MANNNNPSMIPNSMRNPSKEFPYIGESVDIFESTFKKPLNEVICIPDEEDTTNINNRTKFKDKDYNPVESSGLGRVYLRQNFVDGWPSNTWLYHPLNGVVYLLYSYNLELYAIYSNSIGLGLENNLVVAPANYNISDIQSLVGDRYLSFTESEGVYTITKPDGTTITSTELNNTSIYKLNDTEHQGVNVLVQKMMLKPNTIYHIQYDYDLMGQTINVPNNSVLLFEGGSLSNGTTTLNNTLLDGNCSFDNVILNGTCQNDCLKNTWFGIVPDDLETNNDDKWNLLINNAHNLLVSAFVVPAQYTIFSPIHLDGKKSIVSNERLATLRYRGPADSIMIYITGIRNHLRNLLLFRDDDIRYQATAIKLGYRQGEEMSEWIDATYSRIENVECHYFEVGANFERCWYLNVVNFTVNHNVIGLRFFYTEAQIYNLQSRCNVIGVHQEWGLMSLVNSDIEANGIGIKIDAGKANISGTYFEKNGPLDGTNIADQYDYNTGIFERGVDIMCGNEDGKTVGELTINTCLMYSKLPNMPSLVYVDKCRHLNIIGTDIRNLVTTKNAKVDSSAIIYSDPYTDFNLNMGAYAREEPQSEYPCISKTVFKAEDISGVNIIVGGGCGINTSAKKTLEVKPDTIAAKNFIYIDSEEYKEEGEKLTIWLNSNYLKPGVYTVVLGVAINIFLRAFRVVDNASDETVEIYRNRYNFMNALFYKIPVEISIPNNSTFGHADVYFYNFENSFDPNSHNGLILDSVWVYKGSPHNLNICSEYTPQVNNSVIQVAQRAMVIPQEAPSRKLYDLGCYNLMPKVYFDDTLKSIVVEKNEQVYKPNGYSPDINYGTTAQRPKTRVVHAGSIKATDIGYCYFDTDLGKPIWIKEINNSTIKWVDATGIEV